MSLRVYRGYLRAVAQLAVDSSGLEVGDQIVGIS